MEIVSIRNFLKPGKSKAADLTRYAQLLLQGISLHAIEGDDEELRRFRYEIANLTEQFHEDAAPEEMLMSVGVAVRSMEEYNRRTSKFIKAHGNELQAMLGMTTDTIAFLSASSKTAVNQLQQIEKHLERTSAIEDIRVLRAKLSDCLTMVRSESVRLRDESEMRIATLKEGVERTSHHLRTAPAAALTDPATGLHCRAEAEQAIASALFQREQKDNLIALFLLDRLTSVNGRFGRPVGDAALLILAQHLGQQLPENSALFRWSGPAFVAIVEAPAGLPAAERRLKHIAGVRLEKDIESDGRSILLPITCSFMLHKPAGGDSVESLFRTLDKFVALHFSPNQ